MMAVLVMYKVRSSNALPLAAYSQTRRIPIPKDYTTRTHREFLGFSPPAGRSRL